LLYFTMAYTLLGGLGIFFYGMKNMSDSLQVIAGDMIKKAINFLTQNRFTALLVGVFVTMLVQSSSVTTVMVIGFVNASLMNLTQAIGIIFGANIGTTITGWIISIKIGKYGLLLIGLGIIPLLFGKRDRTRQMGRLLFGVGMIFLGLEFMSAAFKPLRGMQGTMDMMAYFSGQNYGAYAACVLTGAILTMIIQSSSAMLGVTMALASTGVIEFHTALALVLGENIGTTITALLAGIGANVNAKRAAYAHAIFNLLGVLIVFSIFPYFADFVQWVIPGDPNFINEAGDRPNIAVFIATGHSIFNVTASLCFLPFLTHLAALVTRLVPEKKVIESHLQMVGTTETMMGATALLAVEKELTILKETIITMFKEVRIFIVDGGTNSSKLKEIKAMEDKIDVIQNEIVVFLGEVIQKSLSEAQSGEAQGLVRIADELESVSDYLDRISVSISRMAQTSKLEKKDQDTLLEYYDEVNEFFLDANKNLEEFDTMETRNAYARSTELRKKSEDLRTQCFEKFTGPGYSPAVMMSFSDMIASLRKIVAHSLNISQAVNKVAEINQ